MEYIRKIIKDNKTPVLEGLPPFAGGLVGYFSYDYIKYSEPSLKLSAKDEESFKDVDLMLFDKIICFDNYRQKIILIVNVRTENFDTSYNKGVMELENMKKLLLEGEMEENRPLQLKSDFRYLLTKNSIVKWSRRAKDIFLKVTYFRLSFQTGLRQILKEVFLTLTGY